MLQRLHDKFQYHIALGLLVLFCLSFQAQLFAGTAGRGASYSKPYRMFTLPPLSKERDRRSIMPAKPAGPAGLVLNSGGPSQPEMTSFKPVGLDNMVNLFTGDFSYNIPLLDVGGYPVNIYYDGNIGMEQEASWVGLGWNINPGTITRNMRGIPDDFDGTDLMTEKQNVKPNITWGGRVGGDFELIGIKNLISANAGVSLGVSLNNYLGPAMDIMPKGGISFNLGDKIASEKSTGNDTTHGLSISANASLDLSSRDGLTVSGSMSLTKRLFQNQDMFSFGLSAGTSFNSRVGIKDLQISGQMSATRYEDGLSRFFHSLMHFKVMDPRSGTNSANVYSSIISFARPSYVPTIRMPLANTAWSGHFQIGGGIFGASTTLEAEVYRQESKIDPGKIVQMKPLVGYMYYQNAVNNEDAVMDFSRMGDREVTAHTPVISAPQYTYDVFAINGEGTGGVVRAYRTDIGYVRDNKTKSTDNNLSAGVDIGLPGHYGGNFNVINTPTTSYKWADGNRLDEGANFQQNKDLHQLVYLRNPGEGTIVDPASFDNVGGTDLVRFQLGGDASSPTIEPLLAHYNNDATVKTYNSTKPLLSPVSGTPLLPNQIKRTQVVTFLTADEAARAALDKKINNYSFASLLSDNPDPNDPTAHHYYLNHTAIDRQAEYRRGHHLSQVTVTEADGKRYVYGVPVYNVTQTDFTFSVKNDGSPDIDNVAIPAGKNWMEPTSELVTSQATNGVDGYYQSTETPAYAHGFLLSGLLSPDYVDVTGDGITEDDLGNAVRFNYGRIDGLHKWRTPMSQQNEANFNAGTKTEKKDDKGIVSYGEREQWYLHSIESKTMIAVFTLADRDDGKSAAGYTGGITNDNTVKRLDHIDLYNKADLRRNGPNARPVKTVNFVYSYRLCHGTPDNLTPNNPTVEKSGGKLTLEKIYFSYNKQVRSSSNQEQYKFAYEYNPQNADSGPDNPAYKINQSDRWGTYKPATQNPASLPNRDYPYSKQVSQDDPSALSSITANAGAWALKKILLPSGAQMKITYESDDYGYVQNKRATQMMQVVGFGNTPNDLTNNNATSGLSQFRDQKYQDNYYVFIRVPEACSNEAVQPLYLEGLDQLAFRYAVLMPKGEEFITSYAQVVDYGATSKNGDNRYIWVKLKDVDNFSPLLLTSIEYLREQLPGQAFDGYDMSDFQGGAVEEILTLIADMLGNIGPAYQDPAQYFRRQGKGTNVTSQNGQLKCFVRLDNPALIKYGGGSRVKKIELQDNWKAMTSNNPQKTNGQFNSIYGQVYDYTTTAVVNGETRTISSGVAGYEPGIGTEENPFSVVAHFENRLPLGPRSYGSVELPVLEGLYPTPSVGYSKVTVRSLADFNNMAATQKLKKGAGIGKQVTEFYTTKDFPVYSNYTSLDENSDLQEHDASLLAFFHKYASDKRALSQGFLVVTNDMNGKLKKQSSYAALDETTLVNYTENFYRNTGVNGLNEKFDFADGTSKGLVKQGNMGVDIELMTDTREFSVQSSSLEIQGQVDLFPVFLPVWLPFIWPVSGESENTYRAVTTTKVVSYHSVVDKVLVMDKGSQVITENILRDAQTGGVLTTKAVNEFNKAVYSTTYPAYWAYSGMGLAYQNIDAVYTGASFSAGKINFSNGAAAANPINTSLLESGDELLILNNPIAPANGCDAAIASPGTGTAAGSVNIIWVYDKNKDGSGLTNTNRDLVFIDGKGIPYTNTSVNFRVIRSGKRNMLDGKAQAVTNLDVSPIPLAADVNGDKYLTVDGNNHIINVSAVEYKEKWQTDKDEIKTFKASGNQNTCDYTEVEDCDGDILERNINPYTKGIMGNFRPYRDMVYFGKRVEEMPNTATNLPVNGFLKAEEFSLYWGFNALSNLVGIGSRDMNPGTKWVFKSQTTRVNARGMELENVDALNIYTAAQYGYHKTLPVAITNNAPYGSAVFEGFEDDGYENTLSGAALQNCVSKKYFDLAGISNAAVTSTKDKGFNAHSGTNVLQISHNTTALKTIPVTVAKGTAFNTAFGSKTITSLSELGGIVDFTDAQPATCLTDYSSTIDFGANSPSFSATLFPSNQQPTVNNPYFFHRYSAKCTTYINIAVSGTYNFAAGMNTNAAYPLGLGTDQQIYTNSFTITIEDLSGQTKSTESISLPRTIYHGPDNTEYVGNNATTYSVFLCKGIYKVVGTMSEIYNYKSGNTTSNDTKESYSWSCSNSTSPDYKSLQTQDGCTYQTGIDLNASNNANIIHPSFSIPSVSDQLPDNKMLFSAWVREDALPANQTSYSNNQVTLSFFNGNNAISQVQYDGNGYPLPGSDQLTVTLTPGGSLIDGWQRYTGYFSAPPGSTSLQVGFVNTGSHNVYFDDIRIHPFHANMKSYIYDPVNLRMLAELDANNYATFYEYDEEGTLIRKKAETVQGVKTITETRSAKQKAITDFQPQP